MRSGRKFVDLLVLYDTLKCPQTYASILRNCRPLRSLTSFLPNFTLQCSSMSVITHIKKIRPLHRHSRFRMIVDIGPHLVGLTIV
jgi:hypothetical protein